MSAPVVIVGTGLAGYNLAREFRKRDTRSRLLLISADDGRSYSKPMLSTGFSKNKSADELSMADAGKMAEQLDAQVWTNSRVDAIEPGPGTISVAGETIRYRDLVLACGAQPVAPVIPGDAAERVLAINDLQDYAHFRQALPDGGRVLILGAGLVGCEYANDLAQAGYQVEMVAPCEQVMPTLLPPALAAALQAALEGLGVSVRLNTQLAALQREGEGCAARLLDGQVLHCDLVLSAIGLRPRTELAAAAGLQINRGIVVDRQLRTSHDNIYALGDCAEVAGLNLLYVMPLMSGARALAATLAGQPTSVSYGAMPITIKTPCCPLVVAPPQATAEGSWSLSGEGRDLRGEYRSRDGLLLGYALSGACVAARMELNRELPALLP